MLRLSRLPRATSFALAAHVLAVPRTRDQTRAVDHPAARTRLPVATDALFTIRAIPNPLLHEPVDFVPINPLLATHTVTPTAHGSRKHAKHALARQMADARDAAVAQSGRRTLSLYFHTAKKATSKSCVIRRRLRSKITAAIRLVVDRNADTAKPSQLARVHPPQHPHLISRPFPEGKRIVLQGWTYVVTPELAVYRTPLVNIVQAVRKALLSLGDQATRLESLWSAPPKRKATGRLPHPPRRQG